MSAPPPLGLVDAASAATPDVFVIADTHFLHANVVAYAGRPHDHDLVMLSRWAETVLDDDVVLHLGDLALGKARDFAAIAEQLTGTKYLIRGNHDRRSDAWYAEHGFTVIDPFTATVLGRRVHFSHEPLADKHPALINVHGHVHRGDHHRGTTDPAKGYVNVSVEVIDYRPTRLRDLLASV